jgi:hypothetical protein
MESKALNAFALQDGRPNQSFAFYWSSLLSLLSLHFNFKPLSNSTYPPKITQNSLSKSTKTLNTNTVFIGFEFLK